jgi:DNA polymerase III delta subunit
LPVIVLAGEEELLISERLEELKTELLDPAWASFNYSCYSQPDLKQVTDAAAAVPFGPGNKVMVFEQCGLFTRKRAARSDEDEDGGDDDGSETEDDGTSASGKKKPKAEKVLADLENALAAVQSNTYLIFSCPHNFDKNLKVSKVFEKHARIQSFDRIKFYAGAANAEMMTWCRKRAHGWGALIEDEACNYLAESNEGNLRQISTEIEKAAIFILPDKKITLAVVSHLSPHASNIFAWIDHWLAGERNLVLSGISEVLSRQPQQSAMPVFALLQTTLSKWLNIKLACEMVNARQPAARSTQRRRLPAADMAKQLQGQFKMNPWVLKNEIERVYGVDLEWLVNKKKQLTRLEKSVKSGSLPDVHALTIFFTD